MLSAFFRSLAGSSYSNEINAGRVEPPKGLNALWKGRETEENWTKQKKNKNTHAVRVALEMLSRCVNASSEVRVEPFSIGIGIGLALACHLVVPCEKRRVPVGSEAGMKRKRWWECNTIPVSMWPAGRLVWRDVQDATVQLRCNCISETFAPYCEASTWGGVLVVFYCLPQCKKGQQRTTRMNRKVHSKELTIWMIKSLFNALRVCFYFVFPVLAVTLPERESKTEGALNGKKVQGEREINNSGYW